MMHINFYRMRIFEAVIMERHSVIRIEKLRPDVPLGENVIYSQIFDV